MSITHYGSLSASLAPANSLASLVYQFLARIPGGSILVTLYFISLYRLFYKLIAKEIDGCKDDFEGAFVRFITGSLAIHWTMLPEMPLLFHPIFIFVALHAPTLVEMLSTYQNVEK